MFPDWNVQLSGASLELERQNDRENIGIGISESSYSPGVKRLDKIDS